MVVVDIHIRFRSIYKPTLIQQHIYSHACKMEKLFKRRVGLKIA